MNKFGLFALVSAAVLLADFPAALAQSTVSGSAVPEPSTCMTIHGLVQIPVESVTVTPPGSALTKATSKRMEYDSKLNLLAQRQYQKIAPRCELASVIDPLEKSKDPDSKAEKTKSVPIRRLAGAALAPMQSVSATPGSPFKVPAFLAAQPATSEVQLKSRHNDETVFNSATLVPATPVSSENLEMPPSSQASFSSADLSAAVLPVQRVEPPALTPQQAVSEDSDGPRTAQVDPSSGNLKPAIQPSVQPVDPDRGTAMGSSTGGPTVFKPVTYLLQRTFNMPGYTPPPDNPPLPRNAPPSALDPVFPSTEFLGTNSQAPMGSNDNNYAQYPLEQYLWKNCPILKKERIRVYGWLNPGLNYGTSKSSNFPMSYIVAARAVHWDQVVGRIERVPDTVQHEHCDWGFRATSLYGEDYRFTTAKGWFSNQLLRHNYLTGWDPCEFFGLFYVPKLFGIKLFDGVEFRCGRYISCPDIEAQLAPDNYLFTHSLMFTFDTYTQTGVQSWMQLNKHWNLMAGLCAGSDNAPWTNSAVPTAQVLARYVSTNNKDSLYLGANDLNTLSYRNATNMVDGSEPAGTQGKANLQQVNINWTHVFTKRTHIATEWYYLWTRDALEGGTVSNGPERSFGGGGGPGKFVSGNSHTIGLVSYWLYKTTDHDYICLRPIDWLADPEGMSSGYKTDYWSGTIGYCHRFSNELCIRPELRAERSLKHDVTPYDNGTKRSQITFACDLIYRF